MKHTVIPVFSLLGLLLLSGASHALDAEELAVLDGAENVKVVQWPNGDVYKGEFDSDGQRTGSGIYFWANGDRYAGDFMEGMRDGSGIYTWANGDRYIGEYGEDKRDGAGTYIHADGSRFEGTYTAGQRDEHHSASAEKIAAEKADITEDTSEKETLEAPASGKTNKVAQVATEDSQAQETSVNSDTTAALAAESPEGKTLMPLSDDSSASLEKAVLKWPNGDEYRGDVDGNGIRSGHGIYTWADGDRYEGMFRDGLRHGEGTIIWTNGDRYAGEFKAGHPDGKGIYTAVNGDRYEGNFIHGKRTGKGTFISASGQKRQMKYDNGRLVN